MMSKNNGTKRWVLCLHLISSDLLAYFIYLDTIKLKKYLFFSLSLKIKKKFFL